MRVEPARPEDIPAWRALAAEVEPLFGPMVGVPAFEGALLRNVERGSAFCVREDDGPPGAPLTGAVMVSADPPLHEVGWLAVGGAWRRRGVGRQLMDHVIGLVQPPAEMVVTTFGPDNPAGTAARAFYERLGFRPDEAAPAGPEGGSRQVFRLTLGPEEDRHDPSRDR